MCVTLGEQIFPKAAKGNADHLNICEGLAYWLDKERPQVRTYLYLLPHTCHLVSFCT